MKHLLIISACFFLLIHPFYSVGQLYLQPGAELNCTNNAIICLKDIDLINNGTINLQPGDGRFVFSGSSNSYIDGSSICMLDELDISKSSGNYLLLNQDANIISAIQFVSGSIDLNGKNIILQQSTSVLINESESSHIAGLSGGSISASSNSVNAPAQYNIGNLGAVLTSSKDMGALTISRSHMPVVVNENSGVQRTFFISPANNSSLDATMRFYYLDEELNGKDESTLGLWKSTDGNTWSFVGADNRDTINNYVEKGGISDFSYWTLTDAMNPLPLTLVSFAATCENDCALLHWETSGEQEISDFIIQKSNDGVQWSDVGTVSAKNVSTGATYAWKDINPSSQAFYRLKILGYSGSYSFSPVFAGGCDGLTMPFIVYPNPTNNTASVRVSVRQDTKAELMLINIAGEVLRLDDWYLRAGVNTFDLTGIEKLASGTYIVRLLFKGASLEQKLIKR